MPWDLGGRRINCLSDKIHKVEKGEPIYKVSKILGHSSIVVTEQHYGHLALQDLKSTVDKIDGVIHLPVAAEWQQEKVKSTAEVSKMTQIQLFGGVA